MSLNTNISDHCEHFYSILFDRNRLPSWDDLLKIAQFFDIGDQVKSITENWKDRLCTKTKIQFRFQLRHFLQKSNKVKDTKQPGHQAEEETVIIIPAPFNKGFKQVLEILQPDNKIKLNNYCPIPGYVTVNSNFQAQLLALRDRLSIFMKGSTDEPFNILLCAPPGFGKTYLVKCLAESLDEPIKVVERNLSIVMNLKTELQNFFDEIRKYCTSGKKVIGFLDEVDITINGEHAYQQLLIPMKDSTISKAVLIFAESVAENFSNFVKHINSLKGVSKGQDFISRIKKRIELPRDLLQAPIEKVIRAIVIARTKNDKLDCIDGECIVYFALKDFDSTRDMESLVKEAVDLTPQGARILSLRNIVEFKDFNDLKKKSPDFFEVGEGMVIPFEN